MISEITKTVQPVGLFAGGTSVSGGTSNPVITQNFSLTSSDSEANYPKGLPSSFSTSFSNGISGASVTASTFKAKVNYDSSSNPGVYAFTSYSSNGNTKWAITRHPDTYSPSGTDLTDVNIGQYGISYSGTLSVGEGIEINYYQGENPSDYSVTVSTITRTNTGNKFLVGDMNLIGYLGTLERYRRQLGGIRSYDPDFASAIGGYPKGSQLEYLQTITEENETRYILRKVLSLIDDNTYNFVETPSYIDNIHWMYCDVLDETTPTLPSSKMAPQVICWAFRVSVDGNWNTSYSATLNEDSYVTATVSPVYILYSTEGNRQVDVKVTATLNGNTKLLLENYQRYNTYHYHNDYGSGKIVKRGTTINVSISAKKFTKLGVCVFAVPAITNSVGRI